MYNAFISYSHAADGRMAPALQLALEKFAKPWYKVRCLDIFRDESSLSVSPHLWSNIQLALDKSEYLIYMASPVSAASKWINKEIEYWVEHKPLEKLLIVLTDGVLAWDEKNNTFLDPVHNSLPDVLDNKFLQEPFYIDLRSLKTDEDLSLNNPIFKKEVLKLAAQLHGKAPKDLAGDEVLAHQKMMRVRNTAIGLLTFLFIAALGAAVIANKNAKEARKQTQIARDSSLVAQQQRGIAVHQTKVAEDSAREAQRQRDNAYMQQQIAIREKNNAVLQQEIAIKERNIAQANFLISEAQREKNATRALLYGKEAVTIHPVREIYAKVYAIYRDNSFYKTIISNQNIRSQDSIAFLPGDNLFITYGEIVDLAEQYEIDIERPFYTKRGKKIFALGRKYRIWNLSGELIDEFSVEQVRATYGFPFDKATSAELTVDNDDSKIMVYKPSGSVVKEFNTDIRGAEITALFLSKSNDKAISVWSDGVVRIWDITSGLLSTYKTPSDGMLSASIDVLVAVSDDGKKMISTSSDGIFRLWDLSDRGLINSILYAGEFRCAAFSNESKNIILVSDDDTRLWDTDSRSVTTSKKDNEACRTTDHKNSYKIGGDFQQLIFKKIGKLKEEQIAIGVSEGIQFFSVMPDNKSIVTVSTHGILQLWNIQSDHPELYLFNKPLKEIVNEEVDASIINIAFSNDGKKMLTMSAGYDTKKNKRIVRLWDMDKGECMMVFPEFDAVEEGDKTFMCFSPDGKKIFISCGKLLTAWKCPDFLDDFLKGMATLEEENSATKRILIRD